MPSIYDYRHHHRRHRHVRTGNKTYVSTRMADNTFSMGRYTDGSLRKRHRVRNFDKRQFVRITLKTMSGGVFTPFDYRKDENIGTLLAYIQQKIGSEGTPHDIAYLFDAGISLFIRGRSERLDALDHSTELGHFTGKKSTQDIFVMPRVCSNDPTHTISVWGTHIARQSMSHSFKVGELESLTDWPVRSEVAYELEGMVRYWSILNRLQYKYWVQVEERNAYMYDGASLDEYMSDHDYYDHDHDEYYDSDY